MDGWHLYNHALLPDSRPHEVVDLSVLNDRLVWSKARWGGVPLLARWTSDFDCSEETGFWYTICDKQFDINTLKAKRRNVIKNGIKYFDVKTVNPLEYSGQIYEVYRKAVESYGNTAYSYQ